MLKHWLSILSGFAIAATSVFAVAAHDLDAGWPATLASAESDNLFQNGGFETGSLSPWITCGGLALVDGQAAGVTPAMVHTGRYAVRMGAPTDATCGNDTLGPNQVAANDFTIPSDAQEVTLSFWYSAIAPLSAGDVALSLSERPLSYLGSRVFVGEISTEDMMPGWHLFRQNLKPEEVAQVRGKTLYLTLHIRFSQSAERPWALYFDDLRIVGARERTEAAPLPADLRGDGTRPIVLGGPGQSSNTYGLYRIDTDGGNRTRLADLNLAPHGPVWSPDGNQIMFDTSWLEPENTTDSKVLPALTSRVNVMNADGSQLRPILLSKGQPGRYRDPPGCTPPACADKGLDALDGEVQRLGWSPDSQKVLSTVCYTSRSETGATGDGDCYVYLNTVPLSPTVGTILPTQVLSEAWGFSWNANNQILFQAGPSLTTRQKGVWELDVTTGAQALLLPLGNAAAQSPDFRSNPDADPVWSPDGRHFVTSRQVEGYHFDSAGQLHVNYAIMLHDRQNLAAPRMVLLVDQGRLTGTLSWSPNGKYVLYGVAEDQAVRYDIWWLDVTTGATGKVTNDGVSINAHWNPAAPSAPNLPPNPNFTSRIYLPVMIRPGTAPTPPSGPSPTPIRYPTLTPAPTWTPLPTPANPTAVPPRGISGRVLYKGVGIAGITLTLQSCFSGTCDIKATTRTQADGLYVFGDVPPAPTFGYQVTYENAVSGNADDPRYLSYWQSFRIFSSGYGERLSGGIFDIATVDLLAPADAATVSLPTTFTWASRGIPDELYRWRLIASGSFGTCDQSPPSTATTYVTNLNCGSSLETQNVVWFVEVTRTGENAGTGASRTRVVSFS